ncbi:MAG: FtsX-like permease family protein, partial [Bacteroidota bacterium]
AVINILGLSVAFICSLFLFLNASFELSYDNFHKNKERIFKPYHYLTGPEGEELSTSMGYPVAPTIKAEIPEIEASTRCMWSGGEIQYKGKLMNFQLNLVDNDFFKVFTFPIIKGNSVNPLADIGNVVISESVAKRVFNNEEPVGKIIKLKVMGEWKDLVVSSVAADSPKNSSVTFNILARPELNPDFENQKNNWTNQHHEVFIKIAPGATQQQVEQKLQYVINKYNPGDTTFLKNKGYKPDANGAYSSTRLLPLSENHFNESIGSGSNVVSRSYIYTLLLISFFILAIACFNFINLNIAQSFTRVKEVGVRKYLGAGRKQIFIQVWGESLLVCLVALIIGVLCSLALFTWFNQTFNSKLSLTFFIKPSTIIAIISGTLLVSFIAGGYPAFVISKLNTISVLKGSITLKKPGIFRNSLIILQFSMACLLMGCTIIAYKQFEFMRTMPLGFNKESIITIPLYNRSNGRNVVNQLRMQLASQSSIVSISGSNINVGLGKDGSISKRASSFSHGDKSIYTNMLTVDYDFLNTLGIKLLKGRDFSKAFSTDTVSAVLVTESMASQFGVTDPIGITFSMDSTMPPSTIIGVIPDFHLYSVHEKTEPLTLDISRNMGVSYVFIKTNSKNPMQVMDMIKRMYKDLEPGREFRGTFMDENTERWYSKEKSLSMLLGISSGIAIVLSCLGLFALALLMIQQRIKEVGVRKVLGASVFNINLLLAKDFLRLVIIAIVIATPLAWWLMNKWLYNFPYHTTISWFTFFMVGVIAIVIAVLTISFHTIKAAMSNPVKSLRTE